jgi:hypothetical protein
MLIYDMKLTLLYIITVEDILITHLKHLQLKIMQERMYEIVEVRNLVCYQGSILSSVSRHLFDSFILC